MGRPLEGLTNLPHGTHIKRAERLRRNLTSYDEDPVARALVREYPEGMSLPAVADYFGVSRQRLHQIQMVALMKLRRGGIVSVLASAARDE